MTDFSSEKSKAASGFYTDNHLARMAADEESKFAKRQAEIRAEIDARTRNCGSGSGRSDNWSEGNSLPNRFRPPPLPNRQVPHWLDREPTLILGHAKGSNTFYGPYRDLSKVLDVPGWFMFTVHNRDTFYTIGSGAQTGRGMQWQIERLRKQARSECNLELGQDYFLAVRYHWPERGIVCDIKSAPKFLDVIRDVSNDPIPTVARARAERWVMPEF